MPQAKRKMKVKAATRRPLPQRKPAPQRAMVVAAPQQKPWLLSPDEVAILKNAVCKGASDEELKYCLAVARRYELDPFQQQIWFVPRWDSEAQSSEGKKGATVYVPQVAMNGLLHVAARDHADFGSYSEPEYGPMIEVSWQYKGQGHINKLKVPEWAKIKAFKKGCAEPTVAKVWWEEIYPNIDFAPLVRRMPRLMLAKCAKAQATRTAYPKTGGLMIPEEGHQREFTDITPGGRIMHAAEPELSPAEQNWQRRENEGIEKLTPEQREVVRSKMKDAKVDRPADCLFYVEDNGKYVIDGSVELKRKYWKMPGNDEQFLQAIWSPSAGALVATPQQLGKLISQFEQLKVKFIPWPPLREPGE